MSLLTWHLTQEITMPPTVVPIMHQADEENTVEDCS